MSVVGIDFGNSNAVIAQAKRGGVDVVLNSNSKRLNPVVASFGDKERYMGDAASPHMRSNYRNTLLSVKRLIGKKFSDPDVQNEIENFLLFDCVQLDNDEIGMKVTFQGAERVFRPQQVLGMILCNFNDLVRTASGVPIADLVMSVPPYFAEAERRAVMEAAQLADVGLRGLINESAAVALAYGMFKSARGEFDESAETKVMFVDAGHSAFHVTIASYLKGKLKILSTASDPNAGCRLIDLAMAKHMAQDFTAKTGVEAWSNPKARIKFLIAAEKSKMDLSPHGVNVSPINLECVAQDRDYSTRLTLEDFENLAADMVGRIEAPIRQAMAEAGIESMEQLAAVEVVGGGARPRCVKRRIAEVLGMTIDDSKNHDLSTTMNMDEAVSRGCALKAAVLSPQFVVREYEMTDTVNLPIHISWDAPRADGDMSKNQMTIFDRNMEAPSNKRLTITSTQPFTIVARYPESAQNMLPKGHPTEIGRYHIKVPVVTGEDGQPEAAKVRVFMRYALSGTFEVTRAQVVRVTEEVETPVETPPADEPMKDAAEGSEEGKNEESAETPKEEGETAAAAPAPEPVIKKKTRYEDIAVEAAGVLTVPTPVMEAWKAEEAAMQATDRLQQETQHARNELETYVYDMRNKLYGELAEYATEEEKTTLSASLTDMEDWLYSDEGFDSPKAVFDEKLAQLRVIGDKAEARMYESTHRTPAVSALLGAVEQYKPLLQASNEQYEHLTEEDRHTVRTKLTEVEGWLNGLLAKQAELAPTVEPVLTVKEINDKTRQVYNVCRPIANKPKPAPAPVPAPAAPADEAQAEGAEDEPMGEGEGTGEAADVEEGEKAAEPAAEPAQMEVDE